MNFLHAHRYWILLCGAVVGYLLVMTTNPARESFRDGWRCIRRYGAIWKILAAFGLSYAFFQIALAGLEYFKLPETERQPLQWSVAWSLPHSTHSLAETHDFESWKMLIRDDPRFRLLLQSILPSIESVGGIFNNIVITFPFSAIAAFLLMINWRGHHAELNRALRRRFRWFGWVIYSGISICALAAIVKPFLFVLPLFPAFPAGPQMLQTIAFSFEYLFGVCIQAYLILLVYVWIRGLNFTDDDLLDFAIRRFGYVIKWASIVLLLSTLLIDLPLILLNFPSVLLPLGWTEQSVIDYTEHIARPALALFLILFSSMQITLVFHSESIRKAVRDHFSFLWRNLWSFGWFLVIAGLHIFILNALREILLRGLGDTSAVAILWSLVYPLIAALLLGWLLASWVCLFKRCEAHRIHADNWIKF